MINEIKINKVTEIHEINFSGQKLIGTHDQLEELCLALEEYLYDEPTYEELDGMCRDLKSKYEELKDKYESLDDNFEERVDIEKNRFWGRRFY